MMIRPSNDMDNPALELVRCSGECYQRNAIMNARSILVIPLETQSHLVISAASSAVKPICDFVEKRSRLSSIKEAIAPALELSRSAPISDG